MLRENENCKQFKNGNMNVRFTPEEVERIKTGTLSGIETLLYCLEWYDTSLYSDEYCISNYATGVTFYNCHSDVFYEFNMNDLEKLENGKTVKLYARRLSDNPDYYSELLILNDPDLMEYLEEGMQQ